MKHIYHLSICLLLLQAFAFQQARATITVDSVHVTLSTCPNNGTAKVYARSTRNTAVFLFNIVTGPVTYTLQNDSTFYSLYPGSYTGWAHDVNSFDSTMFTFSIIGNYVYPVVTAMVTSPVCYTGNGGQLVGQLTPATGVPPYNWQILFPDSTAPQASNTFSALAPGNYIIRVRDGCGIGRTATAHIDPSSLDFDFTFMQMAFINCNTVRRQLLINIDTDRAYLPIKITTTTSQGTTYKYGHLIPTSATGVNPGTYQFIDTFTNVHYGDYHQVCITDTCQLTICLPYDTIGHFRFKMDWTPMAVNCLNGYGGIIRLDPGYHVIPVTDAPLITAVLTNALDSTVVDSFTTTILDYANCNTCTLIPPQPDSIPYLLTVHDACGNVYTQDVTWPQALQYSPSGALINTVVTGCLDSTWVGVFYAQGFGSNVSLVILSGPPISQSTTSHFAYHDTLVYPITYPPFNNYIYINNMPAGTYVYSLTDSCGNSITLSTYFPPATQTIEFTPVVKYGCNGLSSIRFSYPNHSGPEYLPSLTNLATHTSIQGFSIDSSYAWTSLPPGSYGLKVEFLEPYGGVPLVGNENCWRYSDTIIIPVFNDSTFKATAVAQCNGVIHVSVIVDSANGIPPFRYNLVSGPQTLNFQDNPYFVVDTFGTYLASVLDSCGNIDARYVTIDTGRFDPVTRTGGNCAGGLVKLFDVSSPFFTYIWNKPNGIVYTGDTLVINSFSLSDTGLYNIIKIVNINGCLDSTRGSYYLALKDTFQQRVFTCPGIAYQQGNYNFSTPGTYYDTLTDHSGCDSVAVIIFSYYNVAQATITPSQSVACYNTPVTLTASTGTTYTWSNALATTSITVSPSVQTTYFVTVTDANSCSSSASAVVHISQGGADSVRVAQSICQGQHITVGNNIYTQPGHYIDTFTAVLGCDSIVYTDLTVNPQPAAGITLSDTSRCHTGAETLTANGGGTYLWGGGQITPVISANPLTTTSYTVTVTSNFNCSATAQITVIPAINNTIQLIPGLQSICPGDTAVICVPESLVTYHWSNGDSTPCITAIKPGSFTVTATDNNGCSLTSNTVQVQIYATVPPVIILHNGMLQSSTTYASYQWYLNNNPIPGDTLQSINLLSSGSYTLQVTDTNSCTATSAPYITTGIDNLSYGTPYLSVYPNPNNTNQWQVNVSPGLANAQCRLFDVDGKIVYTTYLTGASNNITTSLSAGTYIMRISTEKIIYNIKLVQF